MKTAKTIIVAMSIAIALAPIPALGDTCTFDPYFGDTGVWNYAPNWPGCPSIPDDEDDVIIPDGKTCQIEQADQEALSIDVQEGGTLDITSTETLTIWEDSTVDGHVELQSSLFIGASLTISGDGGDIFLGAKNDAIIDDDGTSEYTLTIEPADPVTCSGESHQRNCSLVVHGVGHIKVALENNAFVVADQDVDCGGAGCCCDLHLEEHPKSGSGFWIAEGSEEVSGNGWLLVEAKVSGSGEWLIPKSFASEDRLATIFIKTSPAAFTGDVHLLSGRFQVEESFCTTGDLTAESGPEGPESKITVFEDKAAAFGGTCP